MRVYALKNLNISDSSSGAAFPTIIQVMEFMSGCNSNHKLVVYGATFDTDFNVVHDRSDDHESYIKFRGSKYVQSNTENICQKVKHDLESGNTVLFSGTPCQVYALSHYLQQGKIITTNLYTVDIICHGTPSNKIWKDFVEWIEHKENSRLIDFSFRYQKAKWKEYPVMAKFENGKQYINSFDARQYTRLFFTHLIMRECCYKCKFANPTRKSDLTIGDFWGISKVIPDFPYKNSVSEVLVNTEKGQKIIDAIKNIADSDVQLIIEECLSNEYRIYQHNLNQPTKKPVETEEFWIDYQTFGLEYVFKKYTEYNWIGKLKHIVKKFLAEVGLR